MLHFYILWKRQKTFGFLTFSGGIEMEHWREIDYGNSIKVSFFQVLQNDVMA